MPFGRAVIIAEDDADGFVFTIGKRLVLNAGVTLSNPVSGIVDIDTALDATQGINDRSFAIKGTIEAFLVGGAAIGMDIGGNGAEILVAATGAIHSADIGVRVDGEAPKIAIDHGGTVEASGVGLDLDLTEDANVTVAGRLRSDATAVAFDGDGARVTVEAGGVVRGDLVAAGDTQQIVLNHGKIVGEIAFGDGADFYRGNGGILNGSVSGGDGNDSYFIDAAGIEIVEAPDEGTDFVFSGATFALPDNVDLLVLVGKRAIDGFGNALANGIQGNRGANRIEGGEGDDLLDGGGDADRLFGGADDDDLEGGKGADRLAGDEGSDTAIYRNSTKGVSVDLAAGEGRKGEAAGDILVGIENIDGSDFDDILKGDSGDNTLFGDKGTDILTGRDGDDVFVLRKLPATWRVTDFVHGEDRIDLQFLGIDDISDLSGNIREKNGNTVIEISRQDFLTPGEERDAVMILVGIDPSVLDNGDFIF